MKLVIADVVAGKSTYINRNGNSYKLNVGECNAPRVEVYYEVT
jgi:hypothetical protein